ncbi:MAG TPA: glycosyltransferase family 1 protein [Thermoanaerobaculia bacterium]|nr:glycosyltransferase family 1 protein [Thermoanaerobaculia bacterium]
MRIGIDASNLRAGGGVTHLVELLRNADPTRHGVSEVIVWSGASTLSRLPKDQPWLRLEHVAELDRSLPWRMAWRRFRLPRLARGRCDMLFHPGGGRCSFRPAVTMCRNMIPFQWREMRRYGVRYLFWRALALHFVLLSAFRKSDGLIFVSEFARERIEPKLPRRVRTEVIPHGVSDRFRVAPRTVKQDGELRLLYTSLIDEYKHQWTVADAVMRLRRDGVPVSIDLVGPSYPPARRKLDAVLARAGDERAAVRVRDEVSHDEVAELARRADAFVFASTCENMPNILIEAMAAGLPIACSNRRPMSDILKDGGVYFDPEDADDIARVLRGFIADPELRAAKAQRAYELALELSWERCADRTFAFLARW